MKTTWYSVVLVAAMLVPIVADGGCKRVVAMPEGKKPKHIVLIGASIGQGWQLDRWPERAAMPGFTAEALAEWQFDKTATVEEVLLRPKRRFHLTRTYAKSLFTAPPKGADVVILKECSSYFPGDFAAYTKLLRSWVEALKVRHVEVILATVVPVTAERSKRDNGKQPALVAYNGWLREFAASNGLRVLDLEYALKDNSPDHFLKNEYTSGDGSHLNSAAYGVLDKLLSETVSPRSSSRP